MTSSRNPSFRKTCLVVLMLATYANGVVLAAPMGGHTVSGTANFQQNGNLTTITAGNRSVINYSSFNIAPNETVRFVQPNATSTVLNRVLDPNPTNIFGRLESNGIITIANPNGVFFQNGSVLNVGGLYAGAGNISTADFTAGRIHFTDLKGDVRNDGVLAAQNQIALMGANVTNNGTMTSAKGLAMMVSGSDVYIGTRNSNVFVQANGKASSTSSAAASGSITNTGRVAAPRVIMGAGDMYSTAIVNTGILQGRNISVNAGRNGTATVGGQLNASSSTAKGGNIQVTGGTVALKGAKLDASGKKGGGTVQVGGDFHGGGTLAHANTTTVDAATTINADATGTRGDGGSVVLWSDSHTQFSGQISARGGALGGNGGSAEVSSGNVLNYGGRTDLRAPAGTVGTLLLDPKNITISSAADTVGALVAAGNFGTTALDGGMDVTLNAGGLSTALGLANITLEANNNIRFSASVTGDTVVLGNGNLTLRAGNSILFDAGVTLTLKGSLTATFNDSGATATYRDATNPITNAQGAVFDMATGTKIVAPGGVTIQGGTLAQYFDGTNIVTSTADANTGVINLRDISTGSATAGVNGGVISVTNNVGTGKNITINGLLDATASVGNASGGNITLVSSGVLATGPLSATGVGTGTGGAISLTGGTAVNLNGAASGGTFTSVGNATLNLNGGTVTTSGAAGQIYNGPVVLGLSGGTVAAPVTTTLTANNGGVITFQSTVGGVAAGTQGLALSTTGTQTFSGVVGGTALASVDTGTGTVNLNGGAVTTSGTAGQNYNGPVVVGAAGTTPTTTLTASNAGPISFQLTLDGATAGTQNLQLVTTGAQTFTGAVGTTALASLTTGTGATSLNGGAVTTSSATGQVYNGPVTLGQNSTVLTANGNGAVFFGSTVDGDVAGTRALTLTTGGLQTFNGAVGSTALASLTTGTGTLDLNGGAVTTSGATGQVFNGPVVLGLSGGTVAVPVTTTLTAGAGVINFVSTIEASTAGTQALVLSGTGQQIFGNTVGAANALASLSAGTVALNGSSVTTSGVAGQSYSGATVLGTTVSLTANGAGPIFFGSTVNGSTVGGQGLTLTTTGLQTFTGAVGSTALAGLTTGTGAVALNGGAVSTSGAMGQVFNGPVTLGLAGGTLAVPVTTTLTSNGGPINFVSTVEGLTASTQALVLTGASTQTFGDTVGATNALASLSTGTVNLNGGVVRTYGGQTYLGPVTLGIAGATLAVPKLNTLSSLNGGEIVFFGTVNGTAAGTQALAVDTAGNETFAGLVGSTFALASLTTDPTTVGGQLNFNAVGSTANPSVKTTGAQTYNDDVRLGNATVLVGTTLTLGPGKTLDGSNATGQGSTGNFINDLTLEFSGATISLSGGVTNDGTVVPAATGTFNNINNFISSSVAGVTLTGDFTTVGGQNFDGLTGATGSPLVLGNPAAAMNSFTLTSTGGGNIVFGPINATAGSLTRALTVNTGGTTIFNGLVGNLTPLAALTLDSTGALGGSTVFNVGTAGTTVTTTGVTGVFGDGAQTYNDPVVFQQATTLASSNATTPANAIIAFASTLDGPGALTINSSAPITFSRLIGNTTALAGLSITAANTTFTIDAGTSTLNKGAVNVGAGGVTITGSVNFGFLNSSLTDATHPSIVSSGPQSFGDGNVGNDVTLSGNTSLLFTGTSVSAGITFNGTVDGAFALSVAAGTETFNKAIGGTTPLASLQTDAFGTVGGSAIFGPNVGTVRTGSNTGADFQTFNDSVVLQGNTTFRSTNALGTVAGTGAMAFNKTVDGTAANAQSLTLDTLGTTTFSGYVGATTALAALTTGESGIPGGATTFQFDLTGLTAVGKGGVNASSVTIYNPVVFSISNASAAHPSVVTTGAQSYASATAALETADTFLTGTTLNLPAGINGQGHDLTLNFSAGPIVVNGGFVNLRNFTTVGNGGTQIGAPGGVTFTTTGFQNYTNAVTLTSDVTLASGNSNITFASTLNGPFALTLQPGTGTAFFNGAVGGTPATNLLSLTVVGNTSIGGGSITTVGLQSYLGSLTLTNLATLTSTAGDQITANSVVGGGKNLTVNAGGTSFGVITGGGNLLFNVGPGTGAVFTSTVNALSLTVTGGVANLSGNVTTNSATLGQSYAQLQLNGNITLRDNASGPITSGLIDGSGAGGQTLSLSTGGLITFNGAVGSGLALGSLTTGGGGTTIFNVGGNGVTVTTVANGTTTGAQSYNENVVLQQTTTLFSLASGAATNAGAVLFGAGLDSASAATPSSLNVLAGNGQTVFGTNATVNANAVNIGGAQVTFNGPVGSNAKLNVLTVGISGVYTTGTNSIDLNGGSVTTILGQTYNDPVTLSADATLKDNNGSAIAFNTTINGDGVVPRSLTLGTTGTVTLGGLIGNVVPLNGLKVTADGGTFFQMSLALTPAGTAGIRTGDGGITVNGPTHFNVFGSSLLDLSHPTVATGGDEIYNGPVFLGQDTSLYAFGISGDVRFNGTVDGPRGLAINSLGSEIFSGIVGGITPLTSLSVDAVSGGSLFTLFQMDVTGQAPGIAGVRVGAGGVSINNNLIFNVTGSTTANPSVETFDGGTQTYNGAATVRADTVLVGDASGATPPAGGNYLGGGAIYFGSSVTRFNVPTNLTVLTGTGTTSFNGMSGGAVTANVFNVTGANVTFNGSVFGLNTLLVAPNGAPGGLIALNGGASAGFTIKTTSGQTYGSPVQLGADTILTNTTAAGDLLFASTVDGLHTLALNTGGRIVFNGLVGSTAALTGLTTNTVATPGLGTQFDMSVGGAAAGVLVNGPVVINDPVTFNAAGSSLTQPSVLTLGNNPQTYNGAVNLTGSTVLVSASALPVGGVYTGGGAINLNSLLGITGAGSSSLSIRAGAGATVLSSAINVASLDLGGGQVNIRGPVTLPGGNLSIEPNDASAANAVQFNGGALTTAGGQTYNVAVLLGADTILTSLNAAGDGGNIVFASTVDGTFALTVNSPGDEVFNGVVGGNTALRSLTTDATGVVGGTARFNMNIAGLPAGVSTTETVTINDRSVFNTVGGSTSIATGGAQRYVGAATLSQDTVLRGNGIAFASTVDGAHGLTLLSTGLKSFSGVVGGTTALTSLTTSVGSTVFNIDLGATPNAPAAVRIDGPLVINGSASFTTNLAGAPNAAAAVQVNGALNIAGPVVFNVSGSTSAQPTVLTLRDFAQTYNGAVTLPQSAVLASAGVGAMTFGSTVDGPGALTLNTSNQTVFTGPVGGSTPLLSFTGGNGLTTINGGQFITQNAQTYRGPFFIGRDTTLTSRDTTGGNGQVFFDSTVDGGFALTVSAADLVTFNGTSGSISPLLSLQIAQGPNGLTRINGDLIKTAGSQTYGGTVVLGNTTALLTSLNAGSNITFQNKLEGGASLTVDTPGNIFFNGAVGDDQPLLSLTTTASAVTTTISGGLVRTTGAQTYGGPVQLGGAAVLNSLDSGSGGIAFGSTVNGPFALTLDTGAPIVFGGAVGTGAGGTLDSLTTQSGGLTTFQQGQVTTTGAQNYGNPVLLAANGTFTGSGIAFRNTVNGGYKLQVTTPGQAFFGGLVGGNIPLTEVSTSTGSKAVFDHSGITTTGLQTYGGTVSLNTDAVLTSNQNRDISFANTVNGPRGLTVVTNGNTTFSANVGDSNPLSSLTVANGGGTTFFNGASVRTTGLQTYNNAVRISQGDVAFTSDNGPLVFGQTIDASQPGGSNLDLTTTGAITVNGDVGSINRLAKLTVGGPLTFGGGQILTTGNQRYMNTVAANPLAVVDTALNATGGTVRFDGSVSASRGLSVTATRVGAASDIVSVRDLDLESTNFLSPLLLLLGNNYASLTGTVRLNTGQTYDPSGRNDNSATIILGSSLLTSIRGTGFTMGLNQKILSYGSLDINVGRGIATVGDLAAKNKISIEASQVVLQDRQVGYNPVVGGRNNGLNFAAPNGITFSGAAITFAGTGNRTASFVTANGSVDIIRVQGLSLFKDPTLATQFQAVAPTLDQLETLSPPNEPVAGGTQSLDTAAALSGALPDQKPLDVASDITISASQMEELKKLGIHPRLAQRSEKGSGASKRALFAQLVDGQDQENYGRLQPIKGGVSRLEPSDFVVVVDRMGEREVQSILSSFEGLYGKDKAKAAEIGGAFQTAFNDYTVAKQTADPAGFADYLSGQKGKYPAVDTAVRGFDDLFGHIEHLGLTNKEVAKSEEHITSDLGVSGVSPEDMVKTINALRKKLPPEKKATSTKAPASAPVANPAPGAASTNPPAPAASKPAAPTAPVVTKTAAPVAPAVSLPAAPAVDQAIPEIQPALPPMTDTPAAPEPTPASTPAPTPAPTAAPATAKPLSVKNTSRPGDRTRRTARLAHRVSASAH